MSRVVMIMLEGFSETYLSRRHTPFLYELADQGDHATLEPVFAFRGIEANIFTGLYPNQHGIWTEFRLKGSVLKHCKEGTTADSIVMSPVLSFLDFLPNDKLRRIARYGLQKVLKRENIQMTHLIPARAINLFEPSLEAPVYTGKVLNTIPTFFDILRAEGQTFTYIEPVLIGAYDVLGRLERATKKHPNDMFWYVKLNEHDTAGHKYGPHAQEMESCLIRLDRMIAKIVEMLEKGFKDACFLLLSAHGMCDVKGFVDLQKQLRQLDIRAYNDYLVFLDSTMARFWFFGRKNESRVTRVLQNMNHGHILSSSERRELKIPVDERCGELLFVLDEGYVIHPSFFHISCPPRGMHGYAYPSSPGNLSPLIIYGSRTPNLGKRIKYADIFRLLLLLIGCGRGKRTDDPGQ